MQSREQPAVLADAADGLSHQLQAHLLDLARAIASADSKLIARFLTRLKRSGYNKAQRDSLVEITPGAAAAVLTRGDDLEVFLEQVSYRGRRLAKLGVSPTAVVKALEEFDHLLTKAMRNNAAWNGGNLRWCRDQLHFLVILTLNNSFYQVREAESRAFYDLFRAEVESRTLEEMMPRFLEVMMRYTNATQGRLYLLAEDGKSWQAMAFEPGIAPAGPAPASPVQKAALRKSRCFYLDGATASQAVDQSWAGSLKTCWSIPMATSGRLFGVMQFAFRKDYHWLPRELDLLMASAERCSMAAEKAKLLEDLSIREDQVRRLAEHMVEVEEAERRRISRELHDEAGQSLLCVRLQLEMLEQDLAGAGGSMRPRLTELREMTEHTIVEIRRLIAALSPAILEQMGLAAALRQLVVRFRRLYPAAVRIDLPRRLEVPNKLSIIVYRLVQEVLNNIAKYSLASHVNLSLGSADGILRLHVEDDGVGFDVTEAFSRRDCFGLSGIRERVALMGGTLQVKSLPKAAAKTPAQRAGSVRRRLSGTIGIERHGTAIRIELPIKTGISPAVAVGT